AVAVAEPLFVELPDLVLERDDLLRVFQHRRLLRQDLDQIRPLLVAAIQPLERLERVERRRIVLERRAVRGHRLVLIAERALPQLRHRQVQVDALRRLLLQLGVLGQRRDQLRPLGGLAVEVGQRAQRLGVVRLELQRLLLRRDRVLEVPEVLAVPAPDLDPQIGRRLRLGDGLHHLRVLGEQVVPLVGRRRQPLQLRRHRLLGVVLAERGLEHDERALLIADFLFVRLGDRLKDRDPLRRLVRELDAREEQLDQLLPVALRLVDLLELDRRGEVLIVELKDPLVHVARAIAVADLVLPHRRRLEQRLDFLRRLVERLGLALERLDALLPARLLREELLERRERAE